MTENLPAVLAGRGNEAGISMERALTQIHDLLEALVPDDDGMADRLEASIGDVEMMIRRIER